MWELDAEFSVYVHLCICGYLCVNNWDALAAATRMAQVGFLLLSLYNGPYFSHTLKQDFSTSALLTPGAREFLVVGAPSAL